MKKLLLLLVVIGIGLIVAAYWVTPSSKDKPSEYTSVSVERGTLVEVVNATGPIRPRDATAVGSELSGKVTKVIGDYNQEVKKGDLLLELDSRMARLKKEQAVVAVKLAEADVGRAEAGRDGAEIAFDRQQELLKKGIGQRTEVDRADIQLRAAKATLLAARVKVDEAKNALEQANLGLELTQVKAPVSGSIIEKKVLTGQLIGPPVSAQLFTIASDLSHVHVQALIAEGDISRVRVGLNATFTVYAYSDNNITFEGKVDQIRLMPTNVQGAVFYTAIVDAENPRDAKSKDGKERMLRPGMTATVEIKRRQHKDVWKMPIAALNFQLDEHLQTPDAKGKLEEWQRKKDRELWKPVWILKDKKPWPIFVRIGGENGKGETGIKDGQYEEVLEWDSELQPKPDPNKLDSFPQVIIAAPSVKTGIFDEPKLKLS